MSKITIIIPVYNTEKYLERCLDSIINQTYKNLEIICINSASTDNSLNILNKYAEKDNRIIIINQNYNDVSSARNIGLEKASGDFIGFVDSDDFIDSDFYEKLHNSIKSNNVDIACASILRINNKKSKYLVLYKEADILENKREIIEKIQMPYNCFIWNKLYSKKLFKTGLRFIQGIIYEDMIFTPDIIELAKRVAFVPDTQYNYWKHSKSLVADKCDKYRADKIYGQKYALEYCRKYGCGGKDEIISKKEYYLFGIKILKVYIYRATYKYYLFGFIPLITIKEY